jgi:hypothetical protein
MELETDTPYWQEEKKNVVRFLPRVVARSLGKPTRRTMGTTIKATHTIHISI